MTNTIKQAIMEAMARYNPDEFNLYTTEAGWETWMNDYTTAQEDEMASEKELAEIEKIQRELWTQAHRGA
jgi:hypothetical protein